MAAVRLTIPDKVVRSIRDRIGSEYDAADIATEAVTLYNWAVGERAKGNLILSSDESGLDMTRLSMPSIERAAPAR